MMRSGLRTGMVRGFPDDRWALVRSAMEHSMALLNAEGGPTPRFTLHAPTRHVDLASLLALGAAPGLLLVWLIPLPLVLPALSIVSFAIASAAALFAHDAKIDRRAPGITLWDIAAVFTLIWIGSGIIGGTRHFVQLFDQLATAP